MKAVRPFGGIKLVEKTGYVASLDCRLPHSHTHVCCCTPVMSWLVS